jgi:putative heme-binding domain-containing protein
MTRLRWVCVSLVMLLMAQIATAAPPAPHWMWDSYLKPAPRVMLRRSFQVKKGLVKAVFIGVCHEQMRIYVNGNDAGMVTGSLTPTTRDLTEMIKPGPNVIGFDAQSRGEKTSALSGVLALIELTYDDGDTQYLVSDSKWRVSIKKQAGWAGLTFDDSALPWAVDLGIIGSAKAQRFGNPFKGKTLADAYNSWRLAAGSPLATQPAEIKLAPGFRIELLRSARPSEGSWVSMAFDPKGRLTIAKERKGLLRFTIQDARVVSVKTIESQLRECRGLLYAFDSLYVNANNSLGFFKLTDKNRDGVFSTDETELLLKTEGGVGHGRNHVVLGPNAQIYLVHGNNVSLPGNLSLDSPYRNFREDQLIKNPWDANWSGGNLKAPGGHVIRTDKDGSKFELFAGGFRNPMDVAFNAEGEMFIFDADLEWDVGLPWYRPTRINHVVSGGEYGWRRGTGKWPESYPDSLPAVVDVGLGSPTGIEFGSKSNFPKPWKKALFACDWAYGRILAVHMKHQGASYTGRWETFATGRPLNVTDLTFGPDGAMYFITGGRGTQSGLYRVTSTPISNGAPANNTGKLTNQARITNEVEDEDSIFEAEAARTTRSFEESNHRRLKAGDVEGAIDQALVTMRSSDRWLRFAARTVLEHQNPALWRNKVFVERDVNAALTGLLAIARVDDSNNRLAAIAQLNQMPIEKMTVEKQLMALRVYGVALSRMGKIPTTAGVTVREKLDPLYPSTDSRVNHELCELLVALQSPTVVAKSMLLLKKSTRPEDAAQYLVFMQMVRRGWTIDQLTQYLVELRRAHGLHGGRYYQSTLNGLRQTLAKGLPDALNEKFASLLSAPLPSFSTPQGIAFEKPKLVKQWTLAELKPMLGNVSTGRSFESGRKAFYVAQCNKCHRIDREGRADGLGPDLTAVGFRLDRHSLLESVIDPSRVVGEKFQQTVIALKDGSTVTGVIVGPGNDGLGGANDDVKAETLTIRTDALSDKREVIRVENIKSRKPSKTSPMPTGLASVLSKEQILDLLAYLESGGNPKAAAFSQAAKAKP